MSGPVVIIGPHISSITSRGGVVGKGCIVVDSVIGHSISISRPLDVVVSSSIVIIGPHVSSIASRGRIIGKGSIVVDPIVWSRLGRSQGSQKS